MLFGCAQIRAMPTRKPRPWVGPRKSLAELKHRRAELNAALETKEVAKVQTAAFRVFMSALSASGGHRFTMDEIKQLEQSVNDISVIWGTSTIWGVDYHDSETLWPLWMNLPGNPWNVPLH